MKKNEVALEPNGLLLCDDLIFSSRITGTAKSLGLQMVPMHSCEALRKAVQQRTPSCIIVDLSNPGLQIAELIQFVRDSCSSMPRIVGYGSHVDTATLHAAREAGCDPVLPRSKFVEELPNALPGWLELMKNGKRKMENEK